jgi:hypothetical protein
VQRIEETPVEVAPSPTKAVHSICIEAERCIHVLCLDLRSAKGDDLDTRLLNSSTFPLDLIASFRTEAPQKIIKVSVRLITPVELEAKTLREAHRCREVPLLWCTEEHV